MAEIKIEKKTPIWPWILVILIILAAVYFFWYKNDQKHSDNELMNNDTITKIDQSSVYMNDENNNEVGSPLYEGSYGTVYKEQAVADYLTFVDNMDKMDNRAVDKDVYLTAFSKLITATKREAQIANVDINSNLDSAMKNAKNFADGTTTDQKSNTMKMAASDVSKALKEIQQNKFNDLSNEADEVSGAAEKIKANGMAESQSNELNTFFDKAANLLQKMNQNENDNQ